MNEHIKELAIKAKIHMVSEPRLEEYTKLVVLECARMCESNEHFNKFSVASDYSLKAASVFKKHFGVEE